MSEPNQRRWMFAPIGAVVVLFASIVVSGCTYTELRTPPPAEEYYEEYVEYPVDYGPPPDHFGEPYSTLSFYGDWLIIEPLGWVWRPHVVYGWRPFYYGQWDYSSWGWTWVSYEPYGWVTFHYGYWWYDTTFGWIWLPGDQWFPSRVSWVVYDDYVAWAPVPPPGHYIGDPWSMHVEDVWVVTRVEHFTQRDVGRYAERNFRPKARSSAGPPIARRPPDVRHIEERTRTTIRPVDIPMKTVKKGKQEFKRMELRPDQRKTVEYYRPRVEQQVLRPENQRTPPQREKQARPAKPEAKPPAKERKSTKPESSKKTKKKG